jgi:hypothetical protein
MRRSRSIPGYYQEPLFHVVVVVPAVRPKVGTIAPCCHQCPNFPHIGALCEKMGSGFRISFT